MNPPRTDERPARGGNPETGQEKTIGSQLNAPEVEGSRRPALTDTVTDLLALVGVTPEDLGSELENRGLVAPSLASSGLPVLCLHGIDEAGACTCGHPDCHSPGKHPRSAHGLNDATTDPDLVEQWWRRRPNSNIGVRPVAGTVVLDVDPRNGGHLALAALIEEHGPIPRTLIAETGSGGLHVWFGYQGTPPGKIAAGLDLKGPNGYLVAPPSVHASGGRYRWALSVPIAPAPSWLRARMAPPRRRARSSLQSISAGSIAGLVRFVEQSVEGERNRRLYWAACRAHEKGLDPAPLVEAAVEIGLEHSAAEKTVDSAGRRVEREAGR